MQKKYTQYAYVGICPVCQQTVSHTLKQRIKSVRDMNLSYGACTSCNTPLLLLTIQSSVQTTAIGLVTDLSKEEVIEHWGSASLSENDVIAVHTLLQKSEFIKKLSSHE